MKATAYLIFVVFWICCAPIHLFAQQEELVSRLYTMKDGLPDQGINSVIQDRNGFIWLTTYSGLSKFDGYTFTNFRSNPGSTKSLTSNRTGALLEDKHGRLWIGHGQGCDLFDPETEKFLLHWSDTGKRNITALKFREREDGKVWICTNYGIYVADTETLSIEKFTKNSRWTWDVVELKDGSLLSAAAGGGFFYDNPTTGQTIRYMHDPKNPKSIGPNYFSWEVLVDKRERVWIGTKGGLELFDLRDNSFTHFTTNLINVTKMSLQTDGKILLGTATGLFEFDPENGNYDTLINGPFINSIWRNKQGVTWVSTLSGLQQLNPSKRKFRILNKEYMIGSIVEDSNHDIWITGTPDHTPNAFLFKLASKKTSEYGYEHLVKGYPGYSEKRIRSLFLDNNKNVWTASPGKLEKVNQTDQPRHEIDIPAFHDPITTFVDSYGTIWWGEWDVVNRYDPKTKGIDFIRSFPSATIYSFFEDSDHNLWIGSSAGLGRYNLETGKLDVFKNDPTDSESLSGNVVFTVMKDNAGTIWVGTGSGLNKMIKGIENDTPKFISWSAAQTGLPSDDVYCVVDGADETLWITCGNYVSHFYQKKNIFKNYDHTDGLEVGNFRGAFYLSGKGLRSSSGHILFGSSNGLVVFHPDSLPDNSYVPQIRVTGFSIHNQPVPVKGTAADSLNWGTPLSQNISYTREMVLSHHQNDFTFEFAALNYVNPESNQYKYKLVPYEKDWVETKGSNRLARYTNISPGKYTFRVIGSNNDGVWNEKGASLVIIIAPPWWRTWWAYSLYAIAAIVIFFSLRRYDINRVVLKHRAEQLSELDTLKTRFFANISHEFRTPITLILGPLKEMYNGTFKGDQKPTLGVMMRNGQRLLRLINQLLDLSKLEVGKMSLQASQTNLVQVLKEIASAHESSAEAKKIKFTLYFEVQDLILFIDQEKIEKIMHNILSNAFKFTKENGEVILHLKVENELQAVISIKDTGIGIPSHELDKVFDRFYQVDSSQTRGYEGSGLGMALAKELVELHYGTITVESIEGSGSTFTVRLPLGMEHLRKEEIIDTGDFRKTKIDSEDLKAMENILTAENRLEKITPPSDHQSVLLIVEDNADMRHYISKNLSGQYQIIEAENGKTGVTLATESVPDLIISDIMMPEMDGYKLCEIIKTNELTSHIPVILLTAKADRESKLAGLEIGADDYLSKPFDADELKLIVRNRIEERRKLRERFSREITLEPKQISITSLDEKFITKVLAIIEDHMDDETFSIDELSREGGYSNMQFYRKIKALAGQTPSQFLRTIRLKRAAELLSKNSDNVTQIAYSVGFSSLSYFNKCFKEQFGVTSGQFADESLKSKV